MKKTNIYNTRSNAKLNRDNDGKTHCTKEQDFKIPKPNTTHFGLEAIRRMCPIIWNFVLEEIKSATSFDAFKKQVKQLAFDKCPCIICKKYIQVVGYLD